MDKRIKSGLAVTPAHLKLCDDNLRRADADSRNAFVEKAIEFYAGYLNARENPNLIDEIFTLKVQQKVEQIGKSLGAGQYKIAVELAVLSHDDGQTGDSGSIETQKTLLTQYCSDHHIAIGGYYCGDREY